ncbi:hypothetical protein P3T43_001781 [Paraburkholderia sp. GAS41]|uniref:baseplate hub protein n=1 Tax=Paraburkholderia sp. GAS41 TaxID=3035134 RepID=UPI003D1DA5AC
MPIGQRTLQVKFTMPNGSIVTLDDTLDLHVHIKRNAYVTQTVADITVTNLSQTLRQTLLSRINAYTNNRVQIGTANGAQIESAWIPVEIVAGYAQPSNTTVGASYQTATNAAPIFTGQAFLSRPIGDFPNMGVNILAATNQVDKTRVPTAWPGGQQTFAYMVQWVASQIGCNYICNTSVNDVLVTNPFSGAIYVGQLVKELAALVPAIGPRVEVFIDMDGTLVARDLGATIANQAAITVDEFIGQVGATEQGIRFKTLLDPRIRLISNVQVQSTQSPWFNSIGWVPFSLEYDLTSRDEAFYLTVDAVPPANAVLAF